LPDVASYAGFDLRMMNALCYHQHEKGFLPLLTTKDAEFVFRDDAPVPRRRLTRTMPRPIIGRFAGIAPKGRRRHPLRSYAAFCPVGRVSS